MIYLGYLGRSLLDEWHKWYFISDQSENVNWGGQKVFQNEESGKTVENTSRAKWVTEDRELGDRIMSSEHIDKDRICNFKNGRFSGWLVGDHALKNRMVCRPFVTLAPEKSLKKVQKTSQTINGPWRMGEQLMNVCRSFLWCRSLNITSYILIKIRYPRYVHQYWPALLTFLLFLKP